MEIVRVRGPYGVTAAVRDGDRTVVPVDRVVAVADLLRAGQEGLCAWVEEIAASGDPIDDQTVLAPVDGRMEVWAAGVTYTRSRQARMAESSLPDPYDRVYDAARPELFFKSVAWRVVGPDTPIAVRRDSEWNVPEPELGVVCDAGARIVGYTVCNDMSSRSIEGENPLYLPQAKVYAGACAVGPGIVPWWEVENPYDLEIRLRIHRGGELVFTGSCSTEQLHRRLDDMIGYLFREQVFPDGVVLCTGTGIVPDDTVTLRSGDIVEIDIDQLGTLRNPVVAGKDQVSTAQLDENDPNADAAARTERMTS